MRESLSYPSTVSLLHPENTKVHDPIYSHAEIQLTVFNLGKMDTICVNDILIDYLPVPCTWQSDNNRLLSTLESIYINGTRKLCDMTGVDNNWVEKDGICRRSRINSVLSYGWFYEEFRVGEYAEDEEWEVVGVLSKDSARTLEWILLAEPELQWLKALLV